MSTLSTQLLDRHSYFSPFLKCYDDVRSNVTESTASDTTTKVSDSLLRSFSSSIRVQQSKYIGKVESQRIRRQAGWPAEKEQTGSWLTDFLHLDIHFGYVWDRWEGWRNSSLPVFYFPSTLSFFIM
jgi:hypothetical protein